MISSETFEQIRPTQKISGAERKPDGVHVRIVSPDKPFVEARAAEPDLEDAFLFCLMTAVAMLALAHAVYGFQHKRNY